MSEENTPVTEDDAVIVDEVAAEEKAHDELVSDVTKMLEPNEGEETAGETGEGEKEEKPSEKDEKPDEQSADAELSRELQTRAEGAGISKELARRLHQSGQLEETVAAFDRKLIDRFQSKETEEKPKETPKEPEAKDQEDVPDPDVYDEDLWDEEARKDLMKRDAHHQRRIDALEAQVAEMLQERQGAFDKRFDGVIDGLGHEDLFGKGESAPEDKQANRDTLFRAYMAVCEAYDVDPNDCDPQWAQRALSAMFPEEVFKQAQQQTIDRLRDAQGKFLSSSKSGGALPAKEATEEEVHEQLVSDVSSYLKKQGVQMSGV